MAGRAVAQRAFPYLVVAGVGFALGYLAVLLFVLPPSIPSLHSVIAQSDTAGRGGVAPTVADTAPAAAPVGSSDMVSGETTSTPQVPEIPVVIPDLAGMSLADAKPVLDGLQLQVIVERDTSSLQPENTVIRQTPVSGTQVPQGSSITIVVSRFPPLKADEQDSVNDSAQLPSRSPKNVFPS